MSRWICKLPNRLKNDPTAPGSIFLRQGPDMDRSLTTGADNLGLSDSHCTRRECTALLNVAGECPETTVASCDGMLHGMSHAFSSLSSLENIFTHDNQWLIFQANATTPFQYSYSRGVYTSSERKTGTLLTVAVRTVCDRVRNL